jgi:putative oxidoreductase
LAPLPLRLTFGFGMTFHGVAKLSRGVGGFAQLLDYFAVPAALPLAWTTTLIELLGGLMLMVGLWVVPLTVPMIVIMLVAMVTVHLPYGFPSVAISGLDANGPHLKPPGYEINLVYIAGLLSLLMTGAGPWSLDSWLARRRDPGPAAVPD